MKTIKIDPKYIVGAISLEPDGDGVRPWRIPYQQAGLFNIDDSLSRAAGPAGVRVRFRTASRTVGLQVAGEGGCFDLLYGNRRLATMEKSEGKGQVIFELPDNVPAGENVLEIWLPQFCDTPLTLYSILAENEIAEAGDKRPKWITYGSSITHCRTALSPARTWPAIVSRMLDFNLTCLGYGGQCHLDGMVARLIRDLPADVITIKCGINIHGGGTLNNRSFRQAIISSVCTIRDKHPDVPIGIISPIYCPDRETTPNHVDYTLQGMREHVQDAVGRLVSCGDGNLRYYDGLEQFGPDLAELLPDGLHPDGKGYLRMGDNMARNVLADLLNKPVSEIIP